jgi:hypothetical protein
MATIDSRFVHYDMHYRRMIGNYDITPLEAFEAFMKFLKEFKFIGTFHYYLNQKYGSFSQYYKKYFLKRTVHYQSYSDNSHSIFGGKFVYNWFEDTFLLFPFADFSLYGSMSYARIMYLKEFWYLYCQENKITNSIILVNKEKNDEKDIGDTRCSWQNLLEECGFRI